MNKIFLNQKLNSADISELNGEINGLAYSGAVIKNHGFYENLVIDLSTLSIAKEKTPIFKDHNPTQVAGFGKAVIDENQVRIKGKISKKNSFGNEILDLAADGFDWEMSLGVYEGQLVEFVNGEFNGQKIEKGIALKNGVIREISIVALGADSQTEAEIFKHKGDIKMLNMNQEQWEKFACGCGGNKDSKPEDLQSNFEASKEEIDKLKADIDALKADIDAKQAELDKIQGEKESQQYAANIKSALKEKGAELSEDKILEASKSKEATTALLAVIADLKFTTTEKKIDPKFTENIDLSQETKLNKEDPTALAEAANQLVRDGKAKDFLVALNILQGAK